MVVQYTYVQVSYGQLPDFLSINPPSLIIRSPDTTVRYLKHTPFPDAKLYVIN